MSLGDDSKLIIKLEWCSEFSVGVDELDQEHRQILSVINLIQANLEEGVKSPFVSECLTLLTRYAKEHFAHEEELMRQCGYPGIEAHIEIHRSYRKKVVELCQRTTSRDEAVPLELLSYVTSWWNSHILSEDKAYSSRLKGSQKL